VQTSARHDCTLEVTANGGHVRMVHASCFEQWRVQLPQDADNHGINAQSMRPGQRVYVGDYPTRSESIGGVAQALAACDPRRVGLFCWAVPETNPALLVGTTHTPLLGRGMPILTRSLTAGQAAGAPGKGDVYWSAYVSESAGTGTIQLDTSTGVSDSTTFTNTSLGWTTPRTLSVDCEDLKTADGLRGGGWDELQVTRWNSGANTTRITSVSVWEE
jgi:hypothetical protein